MMRVHHVYRVGSSLVALACVWALLRFVCCAVNVGTVFVRRRDARQKARRHISIPYIHIKSKYAVMRICAQRERERNKEMSVRE